MGNVARFPKNAFPHVLKHLRRKDGLCVGVFPKDRNEIAENARLLMERMPQEPTA